MKFIIIIRYCYMLQTLRDDPLQTNENNPVYLMIF